MIKIFFSKHFLAGTLLVFVVGCSFAQSATNQRKQLFDANWRFKSGNEFAAAKFDFDDSQWRQLDLPHDWSIEGKIDAKNPTGGAGGYFPSGVGWYRKTFTVPSSLKGKNLSVYFEGIYMNAEVYINGTSLGIQPYGYTSFSDDLTPYIHYGKKNVIAVKVDNSMQINSRWYSGSGIYRHVWLQVTDPIHLSVWETKITTPQISKRAAKVRFQFTVHNESAMPCDIQVVTTILGFKAESVASKKAIVHLSPKSRKDLMMETDVIQPKLWNLNTPILYQAKIAIQKKNKELDKIVVPFGIRSIDFSAKNGFRLNGEEIKLNGGCLHHDNGCLGAAAYDRAEERKVEQLKQAGFNAVRTSHNPPSESFLNACDRLGVLVIDESFDGWRKEKNKYDYARYFDQWWKKDIDAMVRRDRNHPAVIMWSIGNEIIERKEQQAVSTAKMLIAEIKTLDDTRPVTSAMTTWDKDWAIFDPLMAVHDIAGYNYQLHHAETDHARVPSRIIVQTESYPREAFANWALVTEHPYIIGDFVWTARDYLGESAIGRYYYPGEPEGQHWEREFFPWHGAYCGDIDLIGWRKPISHYRNMLYNNTEKLYLAVKEPNPPRGEIKETMWSVWPTWENWTWPGFEGKPIEVQVYSKYPKVRLYLNGRLIGEKETTVQQKFTANFTIPYQAGELRATGVENSKEMESKLLKTSGEANQIKLIPDRKFITANGEDLSFVTVEIDDKNGVHQPNAENELTFTLSGPGVIAGVDNANLKDSDAYTANTRKTWKGRALIVLKSTHRSGVIHLIVKSNGLKIGSTYLESNN